MIKRTETHVMNEVTIAFGAKNVLKLRCKIEHKLDCDVLQNHMKI